MVHLESSFRGNIRLLLTVLLLLESLVAFSQCDSTKGEHVYNLERLVIKYQCITVGGIVKKVKRENDGDYHIRLRLSGKQDSMLNSKNLTEQDSCLVIEIVCACEVKQEDAVTPCQGYTNSIKVPHKGDRIRVTGSFVLDKEHGWMEIHPVSDIRGLK